jgi:transposase
MRKVREIMRLRFEQGLTPREVSVAVGVPFTTAGDQLRRAMAAGLSWPLPEAMSDAELEAALFRRDPVPPAESRPLPDWHHVHRELRRPGVTLMLLWLEYREAHPDGYG